MTMPPQCRASERVAYDYDAANSERIKVTTENNDSYTKTEHNHQQAVGTCLRHVLNCCRIVGGIKNKNIKKQPWSKVECFACGGATVRFRHWKRVSMPPTTQSLCHPLTRAIHIAPRIKTARLRRKKPDDKMNSWKEVVSNFPNDFAW